jgi:hypothetical protein
VTDVIPLIRLSHSMNNAPPAAVPKGSILGKNANEGLLVR